MIRKSKLYTEASGRSSFHGGEKEVSAQNAKKVFEKVFDEDIDPVVYIEENGLKIVEDTGLLTETVKKIVDANPGPLAELLGGKDKVMGFS